MFFEMIWDKNRIFWKRRQNDRLLVEKTPREEESFSVKYVNVFFKSLHKEDSILSTYNGVIFSPSLVWEDVLNVLFGIYVHCDCELHSYYNRHTSLNTLNISLPLIYEKFFQSKH